MYFSNGVQIIPPHDAGIAAAIQAEESLWDLSAEGQPVTDPLQEVSGKHYSACAAQGCLTRSLCSLHIRQVSHAVWWQPWTPGYHLDAVLRWRLDVSLLPTCRVVLPAQLTTPELQTEEG